MQPAITSHALILAWGQQTCRHRWAALQCVHLLVGLLCYRHAVLLLARAYHGSQTSGVFAVQNPWQVHALWQKQVPVVRLAMNLLGLHFCGSFARPAAGLGLTLSFATAASDLDLFTENALAHLQSGRSQAASSLC